MLASSVQDRYHFFAYSGQFDVMAVSLECLLQTRVNLCLSLAESCSVIVDPWSETTDIICHCVYEICQLITERSDIGKNYGLVLFGNALEIIQYALRGEGRKTPTYKLKTELTDVDVRQNKDEIMQEWDDELVTKIRALSPGVPTIRVAHTLLRAVQCELNARRQLHKWPKTPTLMLHEITDQAVSAMPSNFDASLGYTYGAAASIIGDLIPDHSVVSVIPIEQQVSDWFCGGVALDEYLQQSKVLVTYYTRFAAGHFKALKLWRTTDFYRDPGPLQYAGPVSDLPPLIISDLESSYFYPIGTAIKANFPMITSMMSPLHKERLRFRYERVHLAS